MVWFKVCDTLAFHHKAVAAGNAAMGLWVRTGSWSGQQLTEGFIPKEIALTMGTPAQIKRLVAVVLWVEKPGGYQFWQWDEDGRQPTREQVEADRAANRERQRRAREKSKSQRDDTVSNGVTTPVVTVPPTRPDPTRPQNQNPGFGMGSSRNVPDDPDLIPAHTYDRCPDRRNHDRHRVRAVS